MKICGIELKGSEARIVCIDYVDGDYGFVCSEIKKIKLNDPKTQEAAKSFRDAFHNFFEDNNFDKIGVKERGKKGKFAGGPVSFKMEGILQSLDFDVEIIHTMTIKAAIKNDTLKSDEVNAYQVEALKTALSLK